MLKNIIANYVGKFWAIISVFIFVPFYIKILGIEAYGVINFYTVILTLMFFADAGLSATLNRELARNTNKKYLGNLLFTIERVYLAVCTLIAFVILILSGVIAKNWLNSNTIDHTDLSRYVMIIGFSIAFQLFTTLENSGLMGLEKQVLSNTIQVTGNIFRSAVVLIPLHFFPSLYLYFIWQLCVNIIIFFFSRYHLWRFIKTNTAYVFDKKILKTIGKFALGMMMMSVIASLNTQIDKLVISKLLSLKEFSYYSLAGLISQAPEMVITPIASAILPKMTKFSQLNSSDMLKKTFHLYSVIMSVIACSITLILFLFTDDFILLWTHNPEIVTAISPITKILLLGSIFLSFQYMPYYLAISKGHTASNIKFGLFSIIFIIPILIYSVHKYGLIGAPWAWFILNIIAYLYLGYSLIGRFLSGEYSKYIFSDTLTPVLTCLFIGVITYFITMPLPKGYFVLLYSAIVCLISFFANLFIYNKMHPDNKLILNTFVNN